MGSKKESLIRVLEEWVVLQTGKIGKPGNRYDADDFMNITGLLFDLKGIKGESFMVGPGGQGTQP